MTPTAWAVFLGANTPVRLADEWRITLDRAQELLWDSARKREIFHLRAGEFEIFSLKEIA